MDNTPPSKKTRVSSRVGRKWQRRTSSGNKKGVPRRAFTAFTHPRAGIKTAKKYKLLPTKLLSIFYTQLYIRLYNNAALTLL